MQPGLVQVSTSSPLSAACGLTAPDPGQRVAVGSAIQPQVSSNAGAPSQLAGVWEQDRWTGIGARAILTAWSDDAGLTWSVPQALGFSTCAASTAPGADYERTSDPWVSFGRNGTVYASALGFSAGNYLAAGGRSAVLVSRSGSAGSSWDAPTVLIDDTTAATDTGPFYFNDRDSITADPNSDAVYVVWDRISSDPAGSIPAWLGRTLDGSHWSTAVLYDPGSGKQTFNNQIVLLADGSLLDFFTLFSGALTTSLQVVHSADQGATWSAPVKVADIVSVGTTNPITQGAVRDSALLAQVAVDPASGTVAAVWQQYLNQPSAAIANDGIALSLSTDGGKTWSSARQINGDATVAAFSPTVRFLPGGILAVTYYDLRDYEAGSTILSTDAWITESADGGGTWHELRMAGPFDLNTAPLTDLNPGVSGTGLFLGDNQGLASVGSSALAFLAMTDASGAHVVAARPPDPLTAPQAHVY
jgi:BNR repeat-like domain